MALGEFKQMVGLGAVRKNKGVLEQCDKEQGRKEKVIYAGQNIEEVPSLFTNIPTLPNLQPTITARKPKGEELV